MASENRRTPSAAVGNVIGSERAHALGLFAMGVTLEDASPSAEARPGVEPVIEVEFDYDEFRSAFGGNFAERLQLVRFPACVLTNPADPAPGAAGLAAMPVVEFAGDNATAHFSANHTVGMIGVHAGRADHCHHR